MSNTSKYFKLGVLHVLSEMKFDPVGNQHNNKIQSSTTIIYLYVLNEARFFFKPSS